MAALALVGCSGSHRSSFVALPPPASTTAAPPTVSGCGRPHPAGLSAESFAFDGVTRTYQLYVPAAYRGDRRVPVVFEFHGYGSSAHQQVLYGDFRPFADRDDFLIVAPDGQGRTRHFNLTGEPGLQDDVAMVGALLDRIQVMFCVDSRRVYSTGMSDGGAMTDVLACFASDRFAAFAPVALLAYPPGCRAHPAPIVGFAGTADPVVPFGGGHVNCCGRPLVGSAPGAMAGWAGHNGCTATPVDTRLDAEVTQRAWSGCRGAVVFYIVEGGGHAWPGAIPVPFLGHTTGRVDASQVIWDFFRVNRLP
jgi:polyhydroxybutyrate depolymerase